MTRFEAQDIIRKAALECIAKAKALYPEFRIAPRIIFTKRGRSRLGEADYRKNTINFNLDYAVLDLEAFMPTVPHEVAHIVAVAVYGMKDGRGHDWRWRSIDRALGGNGKRCAGDEIDGMEVKKARTTTEYLYVDSFGQDHWIGPTHHSRLQAGGYRARKKGRMVTYTNYSLSMKNGAKVTKDDYKRQRRERG